MDYKYTFRHESNEGRRLTIKVVGTNRRFSELQLVSPKKFYRSRPPTKNILYEPVHTVLEISL